MLRVPRVIPILLLKERGFYKTRRFKNPRYVGDPVNVVKILNEKEADEICILDIGASPAKRGVDFDFLRDVVSECFMPVAYGGGLTTLDDAKRLFDIGIEKVSLNSSFHQYPDLVERIAKVYGSQAVVVSLDVQKTLWGGRVVVTRGGSVKCPRTLEEMATEAAARGAGELLITDIDREGTRSGYNLDLVRGLRSKVNIPIVLNGGARGTGDFVDAVRAGASAVAAGNFFVYASDLDGVLITYPGFQAIRKLFESSGSLVNV